jgi:hypothetical protein
MSARLIRVRIFVERIPKNLLSNRLWIIWGTTLYIYSHRPRVVLADSQNLPTTRWFDEARHYIRWTHYLRRANFPASETGIFFTELGMFGNMSRRLANGASVALAQGIGGLVAPRKMIFHGDIFREGIHLLGPSTKLYLGDEPSRVSNTLQVLVHGELLRNRNFEAELQPSVDAAWEALHDILLIDDHETSPVDQHLVIHIRGGDVFGPRKPRTYGQPPLSFYHRVLREKEWTAVTIVHQDLHNPVVEPLLDLCSQLDIPVTNQMGSILEDVRALLSGHTLVAGRGTFIPAVVGLSRVCSRVYFFEDKCNLVPRRSGITMVRVVDRDKTFTSSLLSQNWANTPEQRALMLEYPMSSLVIESEDSGHSR